MTAELERTLEALLFLSSDPVSAEALAGATGAELHEVVTALERLREYYEFERRGFVVRELAGGFTLTSHPDAEPAARRLLAKPRTPPEGREVATGSTSGAVVVTARRSGPV